VLLNFYLGLFLCTQSILFSLKKDRFIAFNRDIIYTV